MGSRPIRCVCNLPLSLSLSLYIYIYIEFHKVRHEESGSVIIKYKGLEDISGYQYGVVDWNLLGKGLDCIKLKWA